MYKFIFAIIISAISLNADAQIKQHKIVYDLNTSDTAVQSTVLRQFNNILKAAPDAQLEVVCHGGATYMLTKDKAFFEDKMKELIARSNVSFKVCANSMKKLGIDKSQLIELAQIVPVAILELSEKQMEGWSYIKAGN